MLERLRRWVREVPRLAIGGCDVRPYRPGTHWAPSPGPWTRKIFEVFTLSSPLCRFSKAALRVFAWLREPKSPLSGGQFSTFNHRVHPGSAADHPNTMMVAANRNGAAQENSVAAHLSQWKSKRNQPAINRFVPGERIFLEPTRACDEQLFA